MLYKVKRSDLEMIVRFLNRDPAVNQYILSDIQWLGLEHPLFEMYYQVNGGITALIARVGSGFTLYAPGEYDPGEMAGLVSRYQYKLLSGKTPAVRQLMAFLSPPSMVAHQTLSALEARQPNDIEKKLPLIMIDSGNATRYVHQMSLLRSDIREFSQPFSIERTLAQFSQRSVRAVMAMEKGRPVSMAMTSGELPRAALIVSVCTHPEYRGCGYASAVVWHMCRWLLSESKKPFLYWDSPGAGRIYHKLGFVDRCEWRIARY